MTEMSLRATIDLEALGFERGGHLIVSRALESVPVGGELWVRGHDPVLPVHLAAWCRAKGHGFASPTTVIRGGYDDVRWSGARRAGDATAASVVARPAPGWGLAARGALIEEGGPAPEFDLDQRDLVWASLAPRLYAQASANQWDPATAVPWDTDDRLPDDAERAVVQIMTYLVENEQAALLVPSRFLSRIHPHFREVVQLFAVQIADEARHIEVFSRRAALHGGVVGRSEAGGRTSLQTLLEEPDFVIASFLLSVLGEGTFLDLLAFLDRHAPDRVTQVIARLVLQDEARHVAFGLAHLQHTLAVDGTLLGVLRQAIERRHDALANRAGLNEHLLDSLVVLAAGSWSPAAIADGYERIEQLRDAMDQGRRRRLARLGFPADEAEELSKLHTRNFM
jgi:hypothetical protein